MATKKGTTKASEILAEIYKTFEYLYVRWQDEKAYEDFKTYQDHMHSLITNHGLRFISLKKRPFELRFKLAEPDSVTRILRVKGNYISIIHEEA